jgi:fibronectin type III domain protein
MRRATLAITVLVTLCLVPAAADGLGLHGIRGRGAHVVPGAPTHLTATLKNEKVILRWEAPKTTAKAGPVTDYQVVWEAPPIEPLEGLTDTHSTATHFTSAFGAGTYTVSAINKSGTGPPSAPVTVCQNGTTPTSGNCSTSN